MRCSNQGRFRQQVRFLQRQFLQDGDLPFTDVLSVDVVSQALIAANVVWKERIYTPLVTLWVFLSQVLSQDHSCRAAVARLITHQLSRGQSSCSGETGAYCQARKRLPEKLFADIVRQTGQTLDASAQSDWLWKQRRVYLFDGTTVSMPDTDANQHAYPQHDKQKPGLSAGTHHCHLLAILWSDYGSWNLPLRRQGAREISLFRTLWDFFRPGDVVLTDRLYCTWRELLTLNGERSRLVDNLAQILAGNILHD